MNTTYINIDKKTKRTYRKLRRSIINSGNSKKFEKFINECSYTHYELEKDLLNLKVQRFIKRESYGHTESGVYIFTYRVTTDVFNTLYTNLSYSIPYYEVDEDAVYELLTEGDLYKIDQESEYNLITQPKATGMRSFKGFSSITIAIIAEVLRSYSLYNLPSWEYIADLGALNVIPDHKGYLDLTLLCKIEESMSKLASQVEGD